MKGFRYLCDPLFLGCCALYALNRWGLKPHLALDFFQCWFNDLLLIPCALPPLLFVHRQLGLRRHDGPPSGQEILGHWLLWSLLFEGFGPFLMPRATADPRDVLAYGLGALVGFCVWREL